MFPPPPVLWQEVTLPAGTDTSGLPIVAFSLLDTPLHHLIWSASQSTKACLSPFRRETAPWGCVPDRTKYEFCSMFKCSTLSQYFQVKPAFFSRLFHVLPAEECLSAQNLIFAGENRREGRAAPLYFPRRPPGRRGMGSDCRRLTAPAAFSSRPPGRPPSGGTWETPGRWRHKSRTSTGPRRGARWD